MHQLNSTDRFWYGAGGAFALLIVVTLFFTSIVRKPNPLSKFKQQEVANSKMVDEAMSTGQQAKKDVSEMKSTVDSMIEDSMKDFRTR